MSRPVSLALPAIGLIAVVASLGAQIVMFPRLASSLAIAYPETAHLRVPMLVFSVVCVVPIEVAGVLSVVLARDLERERGSRTRESRTATWLGAMVLSLVISALLGLALLVWASVETAEFGMQPGIGLALIVFSTACLATAVSVWRSRLQIPRQPPAERRAAA